MGLTQTKLHFLILKEDWHLVDARLSKAPHEASIQNPHGDTPLHLACYVGRAPVTTIRSLLRINPDAVNVKNDQGFKPAELAEANYLPDSPHRAGVMTALTRGAWNGDRGGRRGRVGPSPAVASTHAQSTTAPSATPRPPIRTVNTIHPDGSRTTTRDFQNPDGSITRQVTKYPAASAPPAAVASAPPPQASRSQARSSETAAASFGGKDVFGARCVQCASRPISHVCNPCGHSCLCDVCAASVRKSGVCPVGRCAVHDVVEVYVASRPTPAASAPPSEGGVFGTEGAGKGVGVASAPTAPGVSAPPAQVQPPLTAGAALSTATATQPQQQPQQQAMCVICMEKPIDHIVVPCGHACVCGDCAKLTWESGGLCPMARCNIDNIIRIYGTTMMVEEASA